MQLESPEGQRTGRKVQDLQEGWREGILMTNGRLKYLQSWVGGSRTYSRARARAMDFLRGVTVEFL